MKIGVLIYTYDRTDDARINMEIIRTVWSKSALLKDVVLVHAFNGEKEWWPEKYLEDDLLRLDNPGHFEGAELLINEGIKTFQDKYPDVNYFILLASDTWLVQTTFIEKVLRDMQAQGKYVASSVWGTKKLNNIWEKGVSLDFSVFDLHWTTKSNLFPLNFRDFKEKYEELFFYNDRTVYLEILFMVRFKQAIARSVKILSDNVLKPIAESYIHRIIEREPVHTYGKENIFFKKGGYRRTMYWPRIGLITHHDPVPKQKVLKEWKLTLGEHGSKFLKASDLSYFNRGLDKRGFVKGKQKIGYGD